MQFVVPHVTKGRPYRDAFRAVAEVQIVLVAPTYAVTLVPVGHICDHCKAV